VALWQYQQFVEPLVDSQPTATRTGWRPTCPDQIPPPPALSAAVQAGSTFFLESHPSHELAWTPEAPDQIARTTLPPAAMPFAWFDPEPIAVNTDELGWRGSAPDRIDRRQPPPSLPFLSLDLRPVLPVPDLSWRAVAPDGIARVMLPTGTIPASAFDPFPRPDNVDQFGWRGHYADLIERRTVPPWVPFLAYDGRATIPVPDLGWQGVYPARVDRAILPSAAQPATWLDPFPRPADVDQHGWRGWYPAAIDRRVPPPWLPTLSYDGRATLPVPDLAWRSIAPDRTDGRVFLEALQRSWTGPTAPVAPAIPDLSWRPFLSYRFRRSWLTITQAPAAAPVVQTPVLVPTQGGMQVFFGRSRIYQPQARPIDVVFAPLAPELAWHPTFADFARGHRPTNAWMPTLFLEQSPLLIVHPQWLPRLPYPQVHPAVHASWLPTFFKDPEPTPLGTPKMWDAVYPDWIARRRPVPEGAVVQPSFAATLSLFEWRPRYPDRIDRDRVLAAWQQALAESRHATIPQEGRWYPRYPDRLDPPWRPRTTGDLSPEPIPNPASPDLAWHPWYPDQLLPPGRIFSPPADAQPLVVLPNLSTIEASPVYPAWLPHRPAPRPGYQMQRFEIVVPAGLRDEPITGRVYVMIARTDEREPRLQIGRKLIGGNTNPE